MKLISATWFRAPMVVTKISYNEILLRDIYDSEELKIESERCKALKCTIEELCTRQNTAFLAVVEKVRKEINVKKSVAKHNLYQACYMFQVERLPVLLGQLGKEHQDTCKEGNITDSILWQV